MLQAQPGQPVIQVQQEIQAEQVLRGQLVIREPQERQVQRVILEPPGQPVILVQREIQVQQEPQE